MNPLHLAKLVTSLLLNPPVGLPADVEGRITDPKGADVGTVRCVRQDNLLSCDWDLAVKDVSVACFQVEDRLIQAAQCAIVDSAGEKQAVWCTEFRCQQGIYGRVQS